MNVCLSCFDMVMSPVAILICAGCFVDVFCGSCVWCSVLVDAFVLVVLFVGFFGGSSFGFWLVDWSCAGCLPRLFDLVFVMVELVVASVWGLGFWCCWCSRRCCRICVVCVFSIGDCSASFSNLSSRAIFCQGLMLCLMSGPLFIVSAVIGLLWYCSILGVCCWVLCLCVTTACRILFASITCLSFLSHSSACTIFDTRFQFLFAFWLTSASLSISFFCSLRSWAVVFLLFSISEQTMSCMFMIRSVIFLSMDRRFFSSSFVVVLAALHVSIMPASSFRKASHSASVSCWDLDHLITALCAVSICLRHLHHSLMFAVCVSCVSSLGISLMSSLVVFRSSA